MINQKCIRWDGINSEHLKFVHQDQWSEWGPERYLKEGDILWNSTGTGTIGRAAVFRGLEGFDQVVVDSHVTVIRCARGVSPIYLRHFIASPAIQNRISEMQFGSTNQVELSKQEVLKTELPLPPSEEQRRIIAKVDSLFAKAKRAREELGHIPPLVERYKQAILGSIFSENRTSFWMEAGIFRLIADARIGLVRSKSEQRETGTPYIRMNHYDLWGRWNEEGLTKVHVSDAELRSYELRAGDILFNTRNSYELVGKVALWPSGRLGYVYNNNLLRLRFREGLIPEFAFLQLLSPPFRRRLETLKSATTSVCAIYQRSLMALTLRYPSVEEQRAIVAKCKTALDWIYKIAKERNGASQLIERLDQSILDKAFGGELVPQDPNDEPASVLLERIRAERASQSSQKGRRAARNALGAHT